jgi:alpha-glucosidase
MRRTAINSLVMAGMVLGLAGAIAQTPARPAKGDPWWKHALIYEIYPRSFQDSNGDGVGDLNGITQRLDYLKDLGVDAIWLSPIYPSPQVDFGYDVSNYEAIDPQYGTMADFDHLVAEAKKRNLRVIMDMVLNHTSDKHPWFIESASSRTNPKRDWYIWRDGKGPGEPPNNWVVLP